MPGFTPSPLALGAPAAGWAGASARVMPAAPHAMATAISTRKLFSIENLQHFGTPDSARRPIPQWARAVLQQFSVHLTKSLWFGQMHSARALNIERGADVWQASPPPPRRRDALPAACHPCPWSASSSRL